MKYARIVLTRVIETWEDENGWGITPDDVFPPSIAAQFEPCPDYVFANWYKIDGEWVPPPTPPESEPVSEVAQPVETEETK